MMAMFVVVNDLEASVLENEALVLPQAWLWSQVALTNQSLISIQRYGNKITRKTNRGGGEILL